jgi:hypothetical protein
MSKEVMYVVCARLSICAAAVCAFLIYLAASRQISGTFTESAGLFSTAIVFSGVPFFLLLAWVFSLQSHFARRWRVRLAYQ